MYVQSKVLTLFSLSVQLEMRCQVHSELAVIEEEEGRLEPALLHLQRALLLDERGVHHERLTSALNLLQLRGTLYQTPSSTEDQAAMLIQQVCGPLTLNTKQDWGDLTLLDLL